jgi:hypothetical protein
MGEIVLVLLVAAVGGASGALRGGQVEGLTTASVRLARALWGGLALLGLAVFTAGLGWNGWPIVLAGLAGVITLLAFAVANQRLPGMVLIGVGLALNLLVIGFNGGMPVTDAALGGAGRQVAEGAAPPERPDALHVRADSGTRLRFLSDTLSVRPLRVVVSIGDVAQYAGLFLLVQGLMVKGANAQRPRYDVFDYRVRGS